LIRLQYSPYSEEKAKTEVSQKKDGGERPLIQGGRKKLMNAFYGGSPFSLVG